MGCTYIRNCLVLIWNSNLTGNSVLLFAKSDNLTRRAVISRLGPLSGLQHEGVRGDRMEGPWWSRSKVLGGHLAGAPRRGRLKILKAVDWHYLLVITGIPKGALLVLKLKFSEQLPQMRGCAHAMSQRQWPASHPPGWSPCLHHPAIRWLSQGLYLS